jgi:DNA processing protein
MASTTAQGFLQFNMRKNSPISPLKEILAYEALWAQKNASFKSIAALFKGNPGATPSDLVEPEKVSAISQDVKDTILNSKTNVLIHGTFDFPVRLRQAKEPVELLYYSGCLDFLNTRCVSIVGTREASEQGLKVAEEITKKLVKDNFTIVSGLALGIDTRAHVTAINNGGRTIGVLGTPINMAYPKENQDLQDLIANEHLLISQVPFYKYKMQDYRMNRTFFLERNKTMAALCEATIIIEAGDGSGSLTQATAALQGNRKLLIWKDCIQNKKISWPSKFLKGGAKSVGSYEDILKELKND